jgi:hypothetical protein
VKPSIFSLYYVSVFFGLAPVSWSSEKKHGYINAGLGVTKLFWTASLNIPMFPLMFHSMYLLLPKEYKATRIVGFATYHIPLYLCCITTMFFGLTVNISKLPLLLYKITQVVRVLIRQTIGPCMYRNTKSRIILQLLLVSTIVITLWVLDISYYCGLHCYYAYFGIFPILVNTVEIIQLLNFVMILRAKYKHVNNYLLKLPALMRNKHTETSRPLKMAFLNFIPKDVREVTPLQSNSPFNKIIESEVKIRCLRYIYTSLYDISQLIKSIYGVSLLGIVVWLFTYSIACVLFALRHI